MIKKAKKSKLIFIIIAIALILRLFFLFKFGVKYNLNSDDLSYVNSGIKFLETGKITLLDELSAQIMPGMSFLIAIFAFLFGKGKLLWLMLKLFWIIMGITSIVYVYKIINLYSTDNKIYGCMGVLFFLAVDFAWMDNLILTETPFMLLSILLIYHSLIYSKTKNNKDYYLIILYYILAIMFRPTIALFPIFLIIFLLLKGHNLKELFPKITGAFLILLIVFVPWAIRNYKIFNKFIPLTYGSGNPLLLGTYQGVGFPKDENLDYQTNVFEKLPIEMKNYLTGKEQKKSYMKKYYQLEYDNKIAHYRMKVWWKQNPKSMIKSYLFYKPKILLYSSFYWTKVFNFDKIINVIFRRIDILLFLISLIIIFIDKKYINELMFIFFLYCYQIAVYSYTFAFSRYAQTLYFYRFIIIGIGLKVLFEKYICKNKKLGLY